MTPPGLKSEFRRVQPVGAPVNAHGRCEAWAALLAVWGVIE